jgi:hypothetical protein
VVNDRMIGLAFSRLAARQHRLHHSRRGSELFLQDVADGRYDGKPGMYDSLQTLENPALRPYLKIGKEIEGIIVTEPDTSDSSYPLQPWDIITRIGDTPVDNEGMVKVDDIRVRFQYLLQKVVRDGKAPLTIVRAGQSRPIELPVSPKRPMAIPDLEGAYPSYFVYGPLVFSAASQLFLAGLNNAAVQLSATNSPLSTRRADRPAFPGEELVVVSSPMHFDHLQASLSAEPLPRADDDDEDERRDRRRKAGKKEGGPVGILIRSQEVHRAAEDLSLGRRHRRHGQGHHREAALPRGHRRPGKEITFYINTPGGSITAGMAVYDTMKLITSPITVVVTGMAASMGSILLSAAKGRRLLYPHSRVLIHQPLISGSLHRTGHGHQHPGPGNGEDPRGVEPDPRHRLRPAAGTHQRDTDRDFYLNAKEAIEYGLADRIVEQV